MPLIEAPAIPDVKPFQYRSRQFVAHSLICTRPCRAWRLAQKIELYLEEWSDLAGTNGADEKIMEVVALQWDPTTGHWHCHVLSKL